MKIKMLFLTLYGVSIMAIPVVGAEWRLVFEDDGRGNWEEKWVRDGRRSTITNTPEGMVYTTGPLQFENASHEVLWTKASFEGDLRIEYDFTRLDENMDHVAVCLLFLHATGTGEGDFAEDIDLWRNRREVPIMSSYFNNMKLLHVSYACSGGNDNRYVRVRQYPLIQGQGFQSMQVNPSYDNVDAFQPGETWHMVFEKIGQSLSLTASHGEETHHWTWNLEGRPVLNHGRVGLRQMRHRSSLFANFKIFQKAADPVAEGMEETPGE